MSPAIVKAYVSRLLARLGVDNRVQIALLVHDAGLDRLSRSSGCAQEQHLLARCSSGG